MGRCERKLLPISVMQGGLKMAKPLEQIIKEYPPRGPLQQFRFDKSISFSCFRCGQNKISKLITIYNNDWNKRLLE